MAETADRLDADLLQKLRWIRITTNYRHASEGWHRSVVRRFVGQQRLDHAPLEVGQVISAHSIPESEEDAGSNMPERPTLPEPFRVNIERCIAALQDSVTDDEANAGWDQPLKARWADWFVNLQAELESGNEIPPGWGILRAMDFDGVSDSALAKRANAIGRLIDEWKPPA